MTTDTTALQERIRAEIIRSECGDNPVPIFVRERADRLADTVLPIIRQAQAEAWEKGYEAGEFHEHNYGAESGTDYPDNPYEQEGA